MMDAHVGQRLPHVILVWHADSMFVKVGRAWRSGDPFGHVVLASRSLVSFGQVVQTCRAGKGYLFYESGCAIVLSLPTANNIIACAQCVIHATRA